jgi:DNA-3-methyladenine glycosylase II
MDQVRSPVETISGTIETIEHVQEGIAALVAAEPRFSHVLAHTGIPPLRRLPGGYRGLLRIITEQQLSLQSAKAIWGRMEERHDVDSPQAILALSDEDFRAVGQSAAKVRTIRQLSAAIMEGLLDIDLLDRAPDEEVRRMLTAQKGIGPWTAEIYLLACLGRRDAWPAGDLALQVAAQAAFDLPARPDARELEAMAEAWRPWRAVAARLIWAYYAVIKSNGRPGDVNSVVE